MVNHARTLLMNVDGSAPLPEYLAEEVVDPAYLALDLPTPLDKVRAVLFGADPDRHMRNYQCRRLLAVAHATPLEQYLLRFDTRVTYDFRDASVVSPQAWVPRVARLAGSGTLSVLGEPDPPDASGRLYHSLLVTTDSPGVATVERLTRPLQKLDFDVAVNGQVALVGTGTTFRLSSVAAGQAYKVEVYSRPRKDLGELCDSASGLGEPVYDFLFGVARTQPFDTFRQLFFRKRELPLRLSALVCAVVFRSEEVRRA